MSTMSTATPPSPAGIDLDPLLQMLGFGAALTFGPKGLSFEAQEAIGGTLSIVAVGLITWMIFWMGKTARHLKANLHHRLDDAVAAGKGAVVVMALLAVGREGLETALFLWAGAKATGASTNPLVGAVLGTLVALAEVLEIPVAALLPPDPDGVAPGR